MEKRLRIPIVVKLVSITLVLLLTAAVSITMKSSDYFSERSKEQQEASNLDQANAKAAEVEGLVASYIDKTKVVASLLLREYPSEEQREEALALSFRQDRDLVSVAVLWIKDGRIETAKNVVNEEYLTQYDLKSDYIDQVRAGKDFPTAQVFSGKAIIRNSSMTGGAPLLTVGIPFVKDELGRITHVAIADVRLDRIQRIFAQKSERIFYLVDETGSIAAHPEEKFAFEGKNVAAHPIVKHAFEEKIRSGQKRFEDPELEAWYIGAFAKTTYGLFAFAQAAEDVILEPARNARREAFFITGLVISSAIFLIFVFSITLTGPVENLVDVVRKIATGNFEVDANVQTRDEIGELGLAVNQMVVGLRERERAMNVLAKTQGLDVAATLMNQDLSQMGGTKKEVSVLFSDLRDFTKFSEGHSPEEVVEMLNEYFERMVACIEKNNGRVNKFIGDAIMAMWGAPNTTGEDERWAMKAAIDMRIELNALNELRISRDQPPIKIGAGIHCGEAVAGTIGSRSRLEYTIIGDTVNQASRIEASTKAFGCDILISDEMRQKVEQFFITEYAGAAEVKGKAEPLRFYKVRGWYDEQGQEVRYQTPYSDFESGEADKIKKVAEPGVPDTVTGIAQLHDITAGGVTAPGVENQTATGTGVVEDPLKKSG